MKVQDAERALQEAVENFVSECLSGYTPATPKRRKVIHDAVWGTDVFSPAEIAILDLPLLQRLRLIHQVALAFYTFPSANHSRLEHTIGVTVMATKMAESLQEKDPDLVTPQELRKLRIAALLHDCGHGFFSHISEDFYKKHIWIITLKANPRYAHVKPHEILSYFIVRSKPFKTVFETIKRVYGDVDRHIIGIESEEIAELILGRAPDKRAYLGSIINGPFDADKLDYIARDSYFTGLRLTTDIDRLLYSMDVGEIKGKHLLHASTSGMTALEQILFSKIQLFSCLYHHPKVRAADALLHQFLLYLEDNWGQLTRDIGKGIGMVKPDNPVDYLRYTDFDFLNINLYPNTGEGEYLQKIINNLRTRNLPVKALVISDQTLKEGLDDLLSEMENKNWEGRKFELQRAIYSELPSELRPINAYEIIIDLPKPPPLNEAELTYVKVGDNFYRIRELYRTTHDWLDTYIANKWRGHVFCPYEPRGVQGRACKVAKDVLEREIGLKFNRFAEELANIRPIL